MLAPGVGNHIGDKDKYGENIIQKEQEREREQDRGIDGLSGKETTEDRRRCIQEGTRLKEPRRFENAIFKPYFRVPVAPMPVVGNSRPRVINRIVYSRTPKDSEQNRGPGPFLAFLFWALRQHYLGQVRVGGRKTGPLHCLEAFGKRMQPHE